MGVMSALLSFSIHGRFKIEKAVDCYIHARADLDCSDTLDKEFLTLYSDQTFFNLVQRSSESTAKKSS